MIPARTPVPRVLLAALVVLLGTGGPAAARGSSATVHPRLVPPPSSRHYVALDELAAELGAQLDRDERTGVARLSREGRHLAVVPGVAAALVGPHLLPLRREVLVRYGRAYVPREARQAIVRLFEGRAVVERPEAPAPSYLLRVCLDPGHGGNDPGAGRAGLYERHIVLPVAKMLAAELRQRGFQAVFTRQTDVFVELADRPAIAARQQADAFVSIHANAVGDPSVHGIEIFYCDDRYDSAARAAAAARAGRQPPPEDVGGPHALPPHAAQAVLQMLYEEYHREGPELAAALKAAFQGRGLHVRSVRPAPYRVLRLAEMPAVLVELGFLTNRAERARLAQTRYQRKLAAAIAEGLAAYRRTLERTRGLSQ